MLNTVVQCVSSKGQIVIPVKIREKMALKRKSKVYIDYDEEENEIVLRKVPEDPIEAGCGMLKGYGVTLKDLLKAKREDLEKEEAELPPPRSR